MTVLQSAAAFFQTLDRVVWGPPLLIMLTGTGVWLALRTRFFTLRRAGLILRCTVCNRTSAAGQGALSPWQTLSATLAATVGTGNIVGVAAALSVGGAGAVFWMWVSALFGMMTAYAENLLAVVTRRRTADGWLGGPMLTIERELGSRWLAVAYAGLCTAASFGVGCLTQIDAVAVTVHEQTGLPPWTVGLALAPVVGLLVRGGAGRVARAASRLVPVMAAVYIGAVGVILVRRAAFLPAAFREIMTGAFDLRAAGGGLLGTGMARALRWGIARGTFSHEAGMGSTAVVGACTALRQPVEQGMWAALAVAIDTLVMGTLTALAVLVTGAHRLGLDGAAVTRRAFTAGLGAPGGSLLGLCVGLFALSTLLGWSVIGSRAAAYLSGRAARWYAPAFALATAVGAAVGSGTVWAAADICNGLMALPNLISLLLLSGRVVRLTRAYEQELSPNPLNRPGGI